MQVCHGGLQVIVSQTVFDIGGGCAPSEHMDSTRMAQTVNRIDTFEAIRGKGHGEVFFAKTIDAVAGEFLTSLIDKETLLIQGLWWWPESRDIELKELSRFRLQFYEAEAIALAKDGQGVLVGVEVVQVQSGDFAGSCA